MGVIDPLGLKLAGGGLDLDRLVPTSLAGDSFWAGYQGACLLALARPLDEAERAAEGRVARAMARWLGLSSQAATQQARRALLFHRQMLLHEVLVAESAPGHLARLLDSVLVVGLEHLASARRDEGTLLLSLHYGLYSSLLPLWLARAAAAGHFRHLSLLYDSGPAGFLGMSDIRAEELETAGLVRQSAVSLLDKRRIGASWVARQVLADLRNGGTALVLPDSALGVGDASRLAVTLGPGVVGLPPGAAWLVEKAVCRVIPVYTRSLKGSHAIVFGPALSLDAQASARGLVSSIVNTLQEQTVRADPSLWEGWQWLPDMEAALTSHPETGAQRQRIRGLAEQPAA